jgi:hypothetical protein
MPFNATYDETSFTNYSVSENVKQCADSELLECPQDEDGTYSAYAWARSPDDPDTSVDPRVLIYPRWKYMFGENNFPKESDLGERIYGQWDSGEFLWPLNYFNIELEIPEGSYLLSLYIMDFPMRRNRSETIEIWDHAFENRLDFQHLTKEEMYNGVYLNWNITGPNVINIKVIADNAFDHINSYIDGIFLNCTDWSPNREVEAECWDWDDDDDCDDCDYDDYSCDDCCCSCCCEEKENCFFEGYLEFVGRDYDTKGDWVGTYGYCGYALPFAYPFYSEVAIGEICIDEPECCCCCYCEYECDCDDDDCYDDDDCDYCGHTIGFWK